MRDYIDIRNEKEKMARSIIKRQNVVFLSPDEIEEKKRQEEEKIRQKQEEDEKLKLAEEVLKRLQAQEFEEEYGNQRQIEKIIKEQKTKETEKNEEAEDENLVNGLLTDNPN